MKKSLWILFACSFAFLFLPACAQRHEQGGRPGGGEHPAPMRGPEPFHGTPRAPEDRHFADQPGHPNVPHVDPGRWVGHDTGPRDPHYHLDHPWEHGHFRGGALVRSIAGDWLVEVPAASGLADSTLVWLRTTIPMYRIGCGIRMTSSSMRILTIRDGIWPTTPGSERMFT